MAESPSAITIVRLPRAAPADPLERLLSTVGRVDLALADALHAGDGTRPYACVRRRDTLDVVCGLDALAQALLRGEPAARLVCRVRLHELVMDAAPAATLRVLYQTPTALRIAGWDHLVPDAPHVFGSLLSRWEALGWPALAAPPLRRVPTWPEYLRYATMPRNGGQLQRGFLGCVRYELTSLAPAERALVWTLARFGEYRGCGRNTGYGLGRLRIVPPGADWRQLGERSVWEPTARRARGPAVDAGRAAVAS